MTSSDQARTAADEILSRIYRGDWSREELEQRIQAAIDNATTLFAPPRDDDVVAVTASDTPGTGPEYGLFAACDDDGIVYLYDVRPERVVDEFGKFWFELYHGYGSALVSYQKLDIHPGECLPCEVTVVREKKPFRFPPQSAEWYQKMANMEDGCCISVGGLAHDLGMLATTPPAPSPAVEEVGALGDVLTKDDGEPLVVFNDFYGDHCEIQFLRHKAGMLLSCADPEGIALDRQQAAQLAAVLNRFAAEGRIG